MAQQNILAQRLEYVEKIKKVKQDINDKIEEEKKNIEEKKRTAELREPGMNNERTKKQLKNHIDKLTKNLQNLNELQANINKNMDMCIEFAETYIKNMNDAFSADTNFGSIRQILQKINDIFDEFISNFLQGTDKKKYNELISIDTQLTDYLQDDEFNSYGEDDKSKIKETIFELFDSQFLMLMNLFCKRPTLNFSSGDVDIIVIEEIIEKTIRDIKLPKIFDLILNKHKKMGEIQGLVPQTEIKQIPTAQQNGGGIIKFTKKIYKSYKHLYELSKKI